MIRPFTTLAAVLAAASGLYLYTEKHRTTLLDQRIDAVVADTQAVRERTSMLQAEWALLNQPDRLQALATRFLPALQPIAPGQFVQLADLGSRLPPVGPPPADASRPPATANGPAGPAAAGPDAPNKGDDGTALLAAATPVTAPPPAAVPASRLAPASVRLASASSHLPALHGTAGRGRPRPSRRPVLLASNAVRPFSSNGDVRPIAAYARPSPILATAWTRTPAPSAPSAPAWSGSALGMAHDTLPPPMAASAAR